MINGFVYTLENTDTANSADITYATNEDGQITFQMSSIALTAASGQADNILLLQGGFNIINTGNEDDTIETHTNTGSNIIHAGDGNDTILLDGFYNTAYGEAGNDNICVKENASVQLADGGEGTNTFIGTANSSSTLSNFENASSLTFTSTNEQKELTIDGKTYTLLSYSSNNNITYTISDDGTINFYMRDIALTAADGQEDKLTINGVWNEIYTGDMDDSVTVTSGCYNVTTDGGDGIDTLIDESDSSSKNFETVNGVKFFNDSGDWGTSGGANLSAGQTVIAKINGQMYQLTNNNSESAQITYSTDENGVITFNMSEITLIAKDGQIDKLNINGYTNYIYTGDMNDEITIGTDYSMRNFVYGEDGDDTVSVMSLSNNAIICGGSGINSLTEHKESMFTYSTGFTTPTTVDWGTDSGTYTLAAGESIIATINGKRYLFENAWDTSYDITYETNTSTGEITLEMSNTNITALDGEDDNLIIKGDYNTIFTNAGNDKVKIEEGSGNIILDRTGTNQFIDNGTNTKIYEPDFTLIEDWGTDGTQTLEAVAEKTVIVNGLTYTLKNTSTSAQEITYSTKNNTITFDMDNIEITAADGQEDKLSIKGTANIIATGDKNDTLSLNGSNNIASTGTGNDNITIYEDNNTVTADDGSDIITVYSDSNIVWGGDETASDSGNNIIYIHGNNNESHAGSGKDQTNISGNNNLAYGGAGYNKVSNTGNNNSYTQMDELTSNAGKFNLHLSSEINAEPYKLEIGSILPNLTIDLSSYDSAITALKEVDDAILDITKERVNLAFQKDLMEIKLNNNLTLISNLNNSVSSIRDADTAAEYNNLLAKAALLDSAQLLQTQISQNQSSILAQLINGLGG